MPTSATEPHHHGATDTMKHVTLSTITNENWTREPQTRPTTMVDVVGSVAVGHRSTFWSLEDPRPMSYTYRLALGTDGTVYETIHDGHYRVARNQDRARAQYQRASANL